MHIPRRSLLASNVFLLVVPLFLLIAAQHDSQPIKDLVARYAAARESRYAESISTLFTDDADQLVSSGTWRRGKEALVAGMQRSTSSNPGTRTISNPGTRTITVETVRYISVDTALADARYIISGVAGSQDRKMWSTFLCVKSRDGWRIAAIRNMLPAQ